MKIDEFITALKERRDVNTIVHHEVIPAREARYADPKDPLSTELAGALESIGIEKLYSHQAEGVDLVRAGCNVVVMTPTASGKSLVYNIPVIESIQKDPEARALYIYPLKGLEQDQLGAFRELAGLTGISAPAAEATGEEGEKKTRKRRAFTPGVAEIYDGDTTDYRRKKIRENPPSVVMTNPDMLHMGILPFHANWERMFRNLRYIVIDEVHTYAGVFGSHVAHVLKRLKRVCAHYGSDPVFITCSATIANPVQLASALTGERFNLVSESGSPAGKRNFIFINPPDGVSPYTVASKVFTSSIRASHRVIAFTKARKVTELLYRRITESDPDLKPVISSYRAGFLPEERREIEKKLFAGEMKGVVSTSALELGVDIGGLDVCVLVGYPGTVTSTWQRSGRAGRTERESLVVMVGLKDALDQYFMRRPSDLFTRNVEAAIIDSSNRSIMKSHLLCAASELYLKSTDPFYDAVTARDLLAELEADGKLRHWGKGDIWYPRVRHPQRNISIREAGQTYRIVNAEGAAIGESSSGRVLSELHPGAIYLHRGAQWRVKKLDMNRREVWCAPADDATYYTRPISDEETEIVGEADSVRVGPAEFKAGRLRVTERVLGYRKKHLYSERALGEFLIEGLPPDVFTTAGVWVAVADDIIEEIEDKSFSVPGGLHALEHAMINALPLYALCDRMDLGGVSYTINPELECAAIFVYDGHEGGVGLTRRGFDCITDWLESTRSLMRDCDCDVSCPSCTQDRHCGNNNEPLDKRAALVILDRWLGAPVRAPKKASRRKKI